MKRSTKFWNIVAGIINLILIMIYWDSNILYAMLILQAAIFLGMILYHDYIKNKSKFNNILKLIDWWILTNPILLALVAIAYCIIFTIRVVKNFNNYLDK